MFTLAADRRPFSKTYFMTELTNFILPPDIPSSMEREIAPFGEETRVATK